MEEQFRRHALEYRRASGRIRHTDQSLMNQRRKGSCTRAALSEWTSPSQRRRQRTLSKKSSREPISSSDSQPAGVLKPDMIERMAKDPLILALAIPTPEISSRRRPRYRPDLDHSDRSFGYPNQVNNVLCFPFMFRGHSTRCNDHQRRNEVCGCAGHNRIDRCRAFRSCCDRLRGINVWSSSPLPDINALRSAPHRANCSGRCQGGYGQRRRYPTAEACRAARTGARKLARTSPLYRG